MSQQLRQVINLLMGDLIDQAQEEGEATHFGWVIGVLCDSGLEDVARLVAAARKRELASVMVLAEEEST